VTIRNAVIGMKNTFGLVTEVSLAVWPRNSIKNILADCHGYRDNELDIAKVLLLPQ
jgi:hypothetical protein